MAPGQGEKCELTHVSVHFSTMAWGDTGLS